MPVTEKEVDSRKLVAILLSSSLYFYCIENGNLTRIQNSATATRDHMMDDFSLSNPSAASILWSYGTSTSLCALLQMVLHNACQLHLQSSPFIP